MEGFDAELIRLRKELDVATTRLSELDVQAKIASPGSGLVAGMDDVIEDDEKEMFTIRHEHRELKQMAEVLQKALDEQKVESERWKKHCAVMTKTNKTLRSQVDDLPRLKAEMDGLKKQVELLEATQEENRKLQVQIVELGDVKGENEALFGQVTQLNSALQENGQLRDQLQEQIRQQDGELGSVRKANKELLTQIAGLNDQVASLSEVRDEQDTNLK